MAKKRNLEISNINNHDDPIITTINVDRNEIMKLTKAAKSWDFTCSFCFKKFPSAQAMGGHQNAHRSERLEEKRLYVKDPIGYRKRAYLRAMKAESSSSSTAGAAAQIQNLHATPKMEIGGGPPKTLQQKTLILCGQFGEFNVADHHVNYKYNFCKPSSCTKIIINGDDENLIRKKGTVHLMNFLPPKELSLAERIIGLHAEDDGEGELGGYGVYLDQKLDLTLKL